MVNFKKLKALINEYQDMSDKEIRDFYARLFYIAKQEMCLTQTKLNEVMNNG